MNEALQEYRQQSNYRRGTVMGLAAAEAFMLIAFILLTLLVFWRVSANTEKERMLEENAKLVGLVESMVDPSALANALAFQERFAAYDPDEMEERLSLMQDEMLRALANEVRSLPQDGLLELTDLAREGAVPGAREKLTLFEESGLQPAEIAGLQANLSSALEEKRRLEGELARLADVRESLGRTGAEIAAIIQEQAGDRIAALGGKILPNGDVIFPDAILFDAGYDTIKPEFDTLLQSFCRLWFETLYEQRDALDTVQVEGHASSEYANLSAAQAFVRNLSLSQRRAAAVFGRCLAYGGDDEVTDWARSSMAAVGYSSSRLIIENGVEDRAASRRVVFALKPKTESQITPSALATGTARSNDPAVNLDLAEAITQDRNLDAPDDPASAVGPEHYRGQGYSALSGRVTHVRDGDTIVIGNQPIRIEGLHAPELTTEIGQRAKLYVEDLIAGELITCWLNGEETYDRKVGVCFFAQQDIAARLVAEGLGRDCPAFSGGRYARFESEATNEVADLPGYCLPS